MPPAETTPRRIHLLSAVIVLAAFVSGAVAGVGLYRWAGPEFRPPLRFPSNLPPHLRGLGLTPEQERNATEIFDRHRPDLEAVLRESYPRMRAVVEETHAELRGILTAEQRRKFDEIESRAPPWSLPGGPDIGGRMPPGPPPGAGPPPPP
jgi:hypothetical protein